MERWVKVSGFDDYEISDLGRVRSLKKGVKILRPQQHSGGYQKVSFWRRGEESQIFVHKLVLEAFVGLRPDGMQACHGDGGKTNNALSNLRWGTPSENQADRVAHGTRYGRPGTKFHITPQIAAEIRQRYAGNITALARAMALPRTTVADVVNRRTHA